MVEMILTNSVFFFTTAFHIALWCFFLNALIASEAFDSSYQPTKPLIACSTQSTAKSIHQTGRLQSKFRVKSLASVPKMFQKLKALVTLLLLHLVVTHVSCERSHLARLTRAGCAVYRILFLKHRPLLPAQRLSTRVFRTWPSFPNAISHGICDLNSFGPMRVFVWPREVIQMRRRVNRAWEGVLLLSERVWCRVFLQLVARAEQSVWFHVIAF